MLERAKQEGTSDIVYSWHQPPYWKMTKNRSGKAERDNPAPRPCVPPPAATGADDSRPTAPMMALTRGGVKDSHE